MAKNQNPENEKKLPHFGQEAEMVNVLDHTAFGMTLIRFRSTHA